MENIGIIVACKEEMNALLESSSKNITYSQIESIPFNVYKFNINGKTAYVGLSQIGEIASSALTQYLITRFNVTSIINFGVCGSLLDNLNVKHVVFIDKIVDSSFDTSFIDKCAKSVHPELGYNIPQMEVNNSLTKIVFSQFPQIKRVTCVCSNVFVDSNQKKDSLAKTYSASICEMESAGIFLTAKRNNVPCLFIKAVSDSKNGGNNEYIKMITDASKVAIDVLLNILK